MHLSRRSLLGAATLGTLASPVPELLAPGIADAATATPAPAAALGYTRLALNEDFTSFRGIDLKATGAAGYSLYTDLPWSGLGTPPERIHVANSVLRFDQAITNQNVALLTLSPRTGAGRSFSHGYFEARMRFSFRHARYSRGWPSFWALPKSQVHDVGRNHHAEIDFFEAYHAPYRPYVGHFTGTLHDARPNGDGSWNYVSQQNRNNVAGTRLRSGGWHVFGCLWQPGKVTWYLDGKRMTEVAYGSARRPSATTWNPMTGQDVSSVGAFSVLDRAADEGIVLMLGTAPNWPLEVDWLRAWQRR